MGLWRQHVPIEVCVTDRAQAVRDVSLRGLQVGRYPIPLTWGIDAATPSAVTAHGNDSGISQVIRAEGECRTFSFHPLLNIQCVNHRIAFWSLGGKDLHLEGAIQIRTRAFVIEFDDGVASTGKRSCVKLDQLGRNKVHDDRTEDTF